MPWVFLPCKKILRKFRENCWLDREPQAAVCDSNGVDLSERPVFLLFRVLSESRKPTMSNLIPASGAFGPSAINTFREGAQQGEEVRVSLDIDGQSLTLLSQGEMGQQGVGTRSVAWVKGETDTTALFVQAMSQSFGARLSSSVAQELGLGPAPGKSLASRVVNQALDMAETGKQAFAGIDFLTALEHSAVAGGAAYKSVLSTLNIEPQSVGADTRALLDTQMKARFAEAAASGQSPVTAQQASDWLRAGLISALNLQP